MRTSKLGMSKLGMLIIFGLLASEAGALDSDPDPNSTSTNSIDIMPITLSNLANVVVDSQVTTSRAKKTRIKMQMGCFAVNLRSVANPVASGTMITGVFDFENSGGAIETVKVQFPSHFVFAKSCQDNPANFGCGNDPVQIKMATDVPSTLAATMAANVIFVDPPTSVSGVPKAIGNLLQFDMIKLKQATTTSSGNTTIVGNLLDRNLVLRAVRFIQAGAPNIGQYFGSDGPLSSNVSWYTSNDSRSIEVFADFPGAARPDQAAAYTGEKRTGFCAAYYSPLMVFFDKKRPRFSSTSNFSLAKDSGTIYWPETNSPGYFLVFDKNKNGNIDGGEEMFGDQGQSPNGFESLAKFDVNRDMIINAKDPKFKKLQLWNDKNSNGKVDPGELTSLAKHGIQEISLKYSHDTGMFGNRALYKQKSSFTFIKNGKLQRGDVLDIWLNEYSPKRFLSSF